MTARKAPQPATKPVMGPIDPRWPPTCRDCGWQGEPGPSASPYRFCGGDPARHIREPLTVRPVAS